MDFTEHEIQLAIDNGDVAADWMTQEELASVLSRIDAMKDYFETHEPGPFAQALRMYGRLGIVARGNFMRQFGYAPEQSAVPRVKITGEDKEQKKLKPIDHQPPLF